MATLQEWDHGNKKEEEEEEKEEKKEGGKEEEDVVIRRGIPSLCCLRDLRERDIGKEREGKTWADLRNSNQKESRIDQDCDRDHTTTTTTTTTTTAAAAAAAITTSSGTFTTTTTKSHGMLLRSVPERLGQV